MTSAELETQIRWEAEQFIPFDINDVYLDFKIVREQSSQQGQMDVVLVAAKKDFVNEYTSVIAEVGLEPAVCDVDAFALETMFANSYETPADSSMAIVNVGASKTNIHILSAGISTFTRDLVVGGNTFTEEIQKQLNVSQEEAETLKIGGASGEVKGEVSQDVDRTIRMVAESVTTEVQRSIDFYTATSADPSPQRIYLCGGTSRLTALCQALQARLGVPVTSCDPFRQILPGANDPAYLRSVAPAAAVAVGLALRYPGDA